MKRTDFSWDDLRVALAVGRTGSLTRAAHALGIDQSTAGRRLTALEAELGCALFVRSRSGLTPTPAGSLAMRRAAEMERRATNLADEVIDTDRAVSGSVRLVGNAWTLSILIETALPRLTETNPELTIRFVSFAPEVPREGEPSLSLWFDVPPRPPEFSVTLGSVPFAVYESEVSPPPPGAWVALVDEDAPRQSVFRPPEALRTKEDRVVHTANDAGLARRMVLAGVGRGILPICSGGQTEGLRRVTDEDYDVLQQLKLHIHPDTVQMNRVQAVVRWLREVFAETYQGVR